MQSNRSIYDESTVETTYFSVFLPAECPDSTACFQVRYPGPCWPDRTPKTTTFLSRACQGVPDEAGLVGRLTHNCPTLTAKALQKPATGHFRGLAFGVKIHHSCPGGPILSICPPTRCQATRLRVQPWLSPSLGATPIVVNCTSRVLWSSSDLSQLRQKQLSAP